MRNPLASISFVLGLAFLTSCATLDRFSPGYDNFEAGLTLFNQGRFAAAVPYLEDATHENPNSAQAYLYLGRAYISQSKWRAAIQPLRTAFRLSPRESQQEILNLLIDATFAAALNDFGLGDQLDRPNRDKEML
jgi:tetratricopeptide (TPR) repeat protein